MPVCRGPLTRVGERTYWEQWADDIRIIAERHVARITVAIEDPGKAEAFEAFVEELRANLNPGGTPGDAVDMLAQHLMTRPVLLTPWSAPTRSPRTTPSTRQCTRC